MMKRMTLVAAVMAVLGLSAFAGGAITIKGSDTLVRLGQRWAEAYMKANPGAVIQVSGGGSGTGIAALLNGTTDICEASRDMKKKEYDLAGQKGTEVYRVSVALDGIAVYLNDKNPVSELSVSQLKGIYTGSVTNWREVGGSDAPIVLYGRENNSGTYAFFKEHVLNKEDYVDRTQTLPGTASVVHAVANDVNGIGYGGIAWGRNVKFAAVRASDDSPAVAPSAESVSSGEYPISRELYWFFKGKPQGELRKLVNWALSADGQQLAEEIGYIPLSAELAAANTVK